MMSSLKSRIEAYSRQVRYWISRRQFEGHRAIIESVEGWLIPGQEYWLYSTARDLPDGARILEIGSYKGKSTLCLAFGCLHTRKHVFAVERWQGIYADIEKQEALVPIFKQGFFPEWERNVAKNGLASYVTPLAGDSREVARIWRAQIDFLFLDGSHKYEDVQHDFLAYFPFVRTGGMVALHDVAPDWPGVFRLWNETVKQQLENVGMCSTIGYGMKK